MIKHLLLAAGIFAVDQYCKDKVEKKESSGDRTIWKGQIILTRYHNSGAFLNMGEKHGKVLTFLVTVVFLVLVFLAALVWRSERRELLKLGYSLMIGGAASNLLDRYRYGYVVDYFSFKKLPKVVFNLGDMAIFLGALLVGMFSALTGAGASKRQKNEEEKIEL